MENKIIKLNGVSRMDPVNNEDRILKMAKAIIEEVYNGAFYFPENFNFCNFVCTRLNTDYKTLNQVLIAAQMKTIEQYVLEYRVSKIKEYLVYTQLSLSEIALKLNLNNVRQLLVALKQQTGLTPSFFKEIKWRKPEAAFSVN